MSDCMSINQLGQACGVTHRTASKWLQRKDFPVQREAPWSDDDVAEIKAWRAANLQPNRAAPGYQGRTVEPPADDQNKDYWLMRKYRAQALQQEGRLLDTDAVMQAWSHTVSDIRDQMLMMPAALQGLLALSDEQTKQLDDYLRRTLDGIGDRVGDIADAAQSVPGGGEGDPASTPGEAEPVGGGAPIHASVDDGEPRPVAE